MATSADPTNGPGSQAWDPVVRLVRERSDQLAQRLRATVPDLRIRVRHDRDRSAVMHASWVELNRGDQRQDTDDVLIELLFVRDTRRANVAIYDRDQATLADEDLPFDPGAGAEQALALARQAMDLVDQHVAEIEAELRSAA